MFIPKKSKTFDRLAKLASLARESAEILNSVAHDLNRLGSGCSALKTLEGEADQQVHAINEDIERFFILPLDKEDISELAESLDDIVDNLEQVGNRLEIFGIRKNNESLRRFCSLILEAVIQINESMVTLKERRTASSQFRVGYHNLQRLEDEGDQLHRNVLRELFHGGFEVQGADAGDPISLVKWKEIFQTLEDTLDRCEDMAVIFSRLRTKYG